MNDNQSKEYGEYQQKDCVKNRDDFFQGLKNNETCKECGYLLEHHIFTGREAICPEEEG